MINFKISELIKSEIAIKNNINNMPDMKSLDNLLDLIFYCLQPIRNIIKQPMIITSGYRCNKLNCLVNGSKNSQHLFGCAADFVVENYSVNKIIYMIKESNVEFDQLINEYDNWVHISFLKNKNRNEIIYLKK